MIKVSIITVCLNSEVDISQTINSVLSQKYVHKEFIVIDGASTDSTIDLIKNYAEDIDHFVSEQDNGIYDALNKGIKCASGDVVGILHAGDVFYDNCVVGDVAKLFKDNKSFELISGNVVFFDFQRSKLLRKYRSNNFRPWMLRFGFMPPHTGSFIKRNVLQNLNGYRDDLRSASDFDFFVRFFGCDAFKFASFDRDIVKMKMGGMSTSGIESYQRTSNELLISCRDNNLYTNFFFIFCRLPVKFLLRVFYK